MISSLNRFHNMPKFLSDRGGFDLIAVFLLLLGLLGLGASSLYEKLASSTPRPRLTTTDPLDLTTGFADWAFCSHEQRVESHPNWFFDPQWGPGFVSGASGCGCGGAASFNGDPETAAMGFGLVPPNDIGAGNPGILPPDGHDHPLVLASTGEVVYVETDFMVPGVGFDFRFTRFWRSGLPNLNREFGPGWSHNCEIALRESSDGNTVEAFLGNGRVEDAYEWNSGTSEYDIPAGLYAKLVKTEPVGEDPYFTLTDKHGVVWTFDNYINGTKDLFYVTSIEDPWGNEITFEYDTTNAHLLDKVTDTENRELTFTRNGSLLVTQVTMSSTAIGDYGNVDIDYTYTSGELTKAEKTQTRLADGGTKQRPYTDYTWTSTAGADDGMLNLVKDCGTTVLDFDYTVYGSTTPRCTKVTNADSEEYAYTYDVSSTNNSVTEDVTRYIDPFGQKQEFIYTDLTGGDRTIDGRRDFLEDETGSDITNAALTTFSRDCDCGRIDEIVYDDGSKEKWTYDTWGGITKYTRVSSDTNDTDLVKQWTYDDFDDYCRPLTSSGWLRAESNPSSKVTWTWNSDGTLQKVAHPTVTSGQPSSQTIEWDYTWTDIGGGLTDGTLASITNAADEKTGYTYSGDTITKTLDPDSGGLQLAYKNVRNVFGQTTQTEDPSGTTSQWDYTVTPDGRVLKVEGPNGQETKYEYNLRGFRTEEDKLLEDSPSNRVETTWAYTSGGRMDSMTADAATGGIQALTDYDFDETNRYSETIGPDDYGSKSTFGYGSHNLPWKEHNIDDSGASKVETLVKTIERNTMGRVVTVVHRGGSETDYEYDGFGRQTKVITDLPSSKTREVVRTLEGDGRPEKVEVKVVNGGTTTTHATTNYYYDQANRQYQTTRVDPDSALTDRTTKVERDEIGRIAVRIDERTKEWETQWDDAGRTSKTIDPIGNEVRYVYNVTARTTTVTHHEYNTDTASFTDYVVVKSADASGRISSIDDQGSASGSRETTVTYDEGGRRVSLRGEGDREFDWEYDRLDRLTKETVRVDASTDAITTLYWTAGGMKERVSDANAVNTRWTYNSFGQELTVEYDDQTAQTYTRGYDAYGRVSTVEDPLGVEKTYVYDTADRIDYIDYDYASSGLTGPDRIDYGYDDMGRMTSAKTQDYVSMSYTDLISVTREYNGFGEMDKETQHGGHEITYSHFDTGEIEKITFPSGGPVVEVEYTLDDNGRVDLVKRKLSTDVEGITTSTLETTAEFEYAGHREYERNQTLYDLVRKQTYTSFREPDELTYKEASTGDLLTGLDCDWDDAGRMVVRERMHDESGGTEIGEVFRYDDMGRLVTMWRELESPHSWTTTDPTAATANFQDKVAYDIGKVYERDDVTITPEAGTPIETIAVSLNDLYQTTSHDGNTLTWDGNGQLTDYGSSKDFIWNGQGQLIEAEISGETDREYDYDAFGRRVSTTVGSQVNEFLYHGRHMIGEWDESAGEWLWQEIPLHVGEWMLEHIALDTNDLDSDSDTSEYRSYAVHEDFQSTVWGLSDTDGDILERYNYTDPYGVSDSEDASAGALGDYATEVYHRKRLHGGYIEAVSELYDFRERWLNPNTGGWLTRDPLGYFDSKNPYQAFLSSPLSISDRMGKWCYFHLEYTVVIHANRASKFSQAEWQNFLNEAATDMEQAGSGPCCTAWVDLKVKTMAGSPGDAFEECKDSENNGESCLVLIGANGGDGKPGTRTPDAREGKIDEIQDVDADGLILFDEFEASGGDILGHELMHLVDPSAEHGEGGVPESGQPVSKHTMGEWYVKNWGISGMDPDEICSASSFVCCGGASVSPIFIPMF